MSPLTLVSRPTSFLPRRHQLTHKKCPAPGPRTRNPRVAPKLYPSLVCAACATQRTPPDHAVQLQVVRNQQQHVSRPKKRKQGKTGETPGTALGTLRGTTPFALKQ